MILYPAIDLKNGKCVRLIQGKWTKRLYLINPLLKSFVDQDVSGSFNWFRWWLSQSLVNQTIIKKIINNVPIPIQLGGGIRNFKTIEHLISVGVQRIILGTIALSDPQLVKKACKHFPNKIAIGMMQKIVM